MILVFTFSTLQIFVFGVLPITRPTGTKDAYRYGWVVRTKLAPNCVLRVSSCICFGVAASFGFVGNSSRRRFLIFAFLTVVI
jgi:hypothetical protein